MLVTRRSPFSKTENTMELDITPEQLARYEQGNELIQNVFPDLSPEHREFIMTGITPEEWELVSRDKNDYSCTYQIW